MAPSEKRKDDERGFQFEIKKTPKTFIVKVSIRTFNLALFATTAGVIGNAIFKWIMAAIAAGN